MYLAGTPLNHSGKATWDGTTAPFVIYNYYQQGYLDGCDAASVLCSNIEYCLSILSGSEGSTARSYAGCHREHVVHVVTLQSNVCPQLRASRKPLGLQSNGSEVCAALNVRMSLNARQERIASGAGKNCLCYIHAPGQHEEAQSSTLSASSASCRPPRRFCAAVFL